ncbi:MAG: hypothetical protein JXA14_20570 [Anaerolineae bacterium]|nr:hypothetical protein [Anaerolineae bacterium]
MSPARHRSSVWPTLLATIACSLAVVGMLSWTPVPAAQAGLPPRPTAEAQAKSRSVVGAQIQLQVQFPADWPWASVHWQDLWTVVQWQDAWGDWHVVEGWQGELDDVAVDDAGVVSGQKTWWVAEKDFGTGPFRWVVTRGKGGTLLAASKSFGLPSFSREIVTAAVLLQ